MNAQLIGPAMKSPLQLTALFVVVTFVIPLGVIAADPLPPATQPSAQDALEQKFAQTMSNAVMAGQFTVDGEDHPPKQDRYTLMSVRKIAGERWLFNARIQFGTRDVTVPLVLPVKWAGDTPVITVTDVGIPGMGSYTARVMIYGDHYAGTWSGGPSHQGMLFGRIEHPAATQPSQKPQTRPEGARTSEP